MTIQIQYLTPEMALDLWNIVAAFLIPAIEQSPSNVGIEGVRQKILDGEYFLFLVRKEGLPIAAVVFAVNNFSNRSAVNILFAGGSDLQLWRSEILRKAETWGKEIGASVVYVPGRKGWRRELAPEGYTERFTIVGKDIGG